MQTTAGLYATIASLDDDTVDSRDRGRCHHHLVAFWSSVSASSRRPKTDEYDDDSISEIEESAADTEIRLTKES